MIFLFFSVVYTLFACGYAYYIMAFFCYTQVAYSRLRPWCSFVSVNLCNRIDYDRIARVVDSPASSTRLPRCNQTLTLKAHVLCPV